MLLMVEKGTRDAICQSTHRYAKANDNTWKIILNALNRYI